ncbi:protein kinase [Microbacterium sp. SORGH_AS_0862]|uniref:protein kinase domain-containing protein n=1 Tax=Microbacterium sp. SORGH_AS_0862 TaxID=3041789 RepID=UPI0027911E2B|nr:protein kinase [Microbacterium sp. SORGH_AS_0862]MDQ1204148.1 serine/threonine protein kinase [Microbacterium sp. SORGH_AS_0862]
MSDILDAVPAGTGSLLAGRYRLIERVGRGGMGTVYRARDELLGRDVAVKLFHSEQADGVEDRRKVGEATMLASLSHPCLVTLFDACMGTEAPSYLVMEYIAGPTLRQRLVEGPLGLDEAAVMANDLAAALEAVHAAGIVHRDVKPSNVMLRARGRGAGFGYQAVLADFGVAHLLDSTRLTTPGDVIGTAAYIAPEQVRGHAPVPASDVYSLGLLLIEAITGRHPFADAPAASMLLVRLTRQPDVPAGIGYAWRSLLTAMTVHDPASRPSASEVLDRVRAVPSATTTAATVPLDDALLVTTSPIAVSAASPQVTEPIDAPIAAPSSRRRRHGIVAMTAAAAVLIVAAVAVGITTVLAPAPVTEESVVPVQLNTVPADDGSEQTPAETVESDDQTVEPADTGTDAPQPEPSTEPQPEPVTDPQPGPASDNGSNRGPGNNNGNGNGNGKKP